MPSIMVLRRDTEEETFNLVARAIDECDIVLLTGGVSMGDFDFVPKVLKLAGVEIIIRQGGSTAW